MGKKFLACLLAVSMLSANVDYTAFAAEDVEEAVSNIGESVDVEAETEESETNIEEKSTENFSDDEKELENIEEPQENDGIEKESKTEIQKTEYTGEENIETEELGHVEKEIEEGSMTEYNFDLENEEKIFFEAEMEGVYEFGDSPSGSRKQYDNTTYSMRINRAHEYIYQEIMKSYAAGESETLIELLDYEISADYVNHLISGVINDYPELYFINKKYNYALSGDVIDLVLVTYDTSLSQDKFKQETERALSVVEPSMSDLEKAIVLHDYLTVNCEYDKERLANKTIPYISYSAYGVLVNNIAVCQGYALAYKYLLNQVGIKCYMVSSDSMNHAWNLIVLDGEYYQVDVTWDDPTWDMVGKARHTYMFLSDSAFEKAGSGHSDWNVTSGMDIVDYKATSTRYDNAFWEDCNSPLVITDDSCYYVSFSKQVIKKATMTNIEGTGTTVCEIGEWPSWTNSSSAWAGTYSGLFRVHDRLYYNDKSSIYSIDLDGGNKKIEFTGDTSSGYIYGSALRQGKVYYCLRTTPYITAKETVLTADIDLGIDDGKGITWTLNNGKLTISGSGAMEDYSDQFKAPWYSEQDSITTVVIEDGISNIGNYAFYKCNHLTKIDIPNSVTIIGDVAFYECNQIKDINIPSNVVEIGDAAFLGCNSLTEINIPEGITCISSSLFYNCDHLKNVTIPESVLSIDNYAFKGCSSLIEIKIPEKVTKIGYYAFADCSSLSSVNIPQKLTVISTSLFYNCSSLTNITIPEDVTVIGPMAFGNCSSLSKIIIPASVAIFGGETKAGVEGAFSGCNGLTSAGPIGGGYCYEYGWTEKLPDRAFWGCNSLEKVVIPDSIVDLGNETFSKCYKLTDINIPQGVTSIGACVFEECGSLTDFIISENITSIGGGAFTRCGNLKNIIIPENVTSIGGGAFYHCRALESITIPKSITSIQRSTFDGCSSLTEIQLLESITDIEKNAFYECSSLTEIRLPEGVTNIGDYAFYGCENLVNIVMPQTVTDIGYCAFQNCSMLSEIEIPNGVTKIDSETFLNCSSLKSVIVSDSVTTISRDAFKDCTNLSKIIIPENVTTIGGEGWKFVWIGAFSGCNSLLSAGPIGGGYNLEFGWTSSIPEKALFDCSSLTSLVIPEGITTINSSAFCGCSNLKTIIIPSSVTVISEKAFFGCSNITDIYYNGSLVQWKEINISGENTCLESANIHYNTKLCTITFDADNGITDISYKIVLSNETCGTLPVPERDGYNFAGWYTKLNGAGEKVTAETTVTYSMTVYAKWEKLAEPVITYTVNFDMQQHGKQIEPMLVNAGEQLTMPSAPIEDGYTFEGWYKEKACQTAWNFDKDFINSDITLYAKWLMNVPKKVIAEGKIDESYGNIVWSIDEDGHLLVTGRGDYYSVGNGNPAEPPWLEYKGKIKTAKIALSGSKSVYAMFRDCTRLTKVDLSELNTDNVKYMYYMFDGCSSLTEVDLSNFKTSNVYTMMAMFQGCSKLKALDLSNFDTSSLVDMEAMFLGCSNLSNLDVSNFKTNNVYAMGSTFGFCKKLTNLDLSSFDTRNVTRMCSMFGDCSTLTVLDLSHFDTGKVKDMCYMFKGCKSLETLDISNFNTSSVSKEDRCEGLLSGCVSLSYINAPKNCTYSVELPVAVSTDKWYLNENTECTELPQNLGYSVKLYKNFYLGSSEDSAVVKFDLQNHGVEIDEVIIKKGEKIHKPTDPAAEGYTFEGWYKESECQTAWDFDNDIVTENTTLYAKWTYTGNTSEGDLPNNGIPEGLWIAGIQEYTYTGKAVKPELRVYFKNIKLKEGQDYTISYKNNIKAAGMNDKTAPTVTIKGKGNYSGTAVKTFTINKAMLTVSSLKAASAYQIGKAYTPVLILNGNVLKNKTDYLLTYKDVNGTVLQKQPTQELGSYIMHIEGKGNCGGSFDFKYKIAQNGSTSIEKGKASVSDMLYGGKYPSTMLYVNGTALTSKDYTVVFSNTNAKGTATATFIGIGSYTGVLKKNFKVVALPLQNNNITVAKSVLYEKGGARPEVSVKVNGVKLSEGVDYTVSYKDNIKLGTTAKVIVKGKGNYSGSASTDFQVKGKALNEKNLKILIPDVVTGKKPIVTIYDANGKKLSSGSDYEAKIDQIKHTVTITGGKNGCYTGTVLKSYQEMAADKIITSVKLNKNASGFPKNYNAYTGKEVTLKNEWLTVKAKNAVLPSNCFTLSYMNNVEKGTATVIVQGKNGYSGIKIMTFKIKTYGLDSILTWFVPKPDETENRTFTVKFIANGGSWGNTDEMTVTVENGLTVVFPDEPVREGYVFTGWQDRDGNVFSEDMPVTKDITVYAQWGAETSLGSFVVTGGTSGIDYRYLDNTLTILTNKSITIANKDPKIPVSDTITVADKVNANITLAGVNINVKETGSSASLGKAALQIADDSVGNVTITLAKDTKNVLLSGYGRAGVEKDGNKNSGTLTIAGEGVLTAAGGYGAAGIGGKNRAEGGDCFHVIITGGEITADGGYFGAGIGSGGNDGNSGSITISGGNITANGGDYGAGVGGGNSENININGHAVLFATGGKYGAGIGGSGAGSTYGQASLLTISGSAEVTAVGGDYSAGIGGSACNNANSIRIENNAKVKSTGGEKGAGIGGGGYYNPKGLQIDYGCNGSDIVICDFAEVTARGGKYGAGIGGGDYGDGKDITIKDSANVSATGGDYGAGIGGGGSGDEYDKNSNIIGGNGNNIIIDGGIVTATGGKYGAGIGGGGNDWDAGGTGNGITISGSAKVTTSGGDYGAGIGGGSALRGSGKGSNITINGNVIVFVETGGIGYSGLDTGTVSGGSASFIRGMVFNGTAGVIYGSVVLNVDVEVPKNYTLTVPDGMALDVSHVIFTNNGKITVETGGTITGDILGNGILEKEEAPTNSYADPFELPDLSGDRRADFIAVAMSQVGYVEGIDGSSYFGAWAGDPYCNWCSEFAAWCAEQANIPKTVIPKGTSSKKYRNFFADKGRYYYIAEGIDGKNTEFMNGYKNIGTISIEDLVVGDIILKESDGDINNGPDHTAIFLEYEDGIVTYVSGNTNDSVMVSHCYIEEFHGVCRPDF